MIFEQGQKMTAEFLQKWKLSIEPEFKNDSQLEKIENESFVLRLDSFFSFFRLYHGNNGYWAKELMSNVKETQLI